MSRVLITGGSGFIGGALARRLRDQHVDVWAPTRAELDLERPGSLEQLVGGRGITVLVHSAASRERTDPAPSRFVGETSINVNATARLFDAARRAGVGAVVHVSTLSVFCPVAVGELIVETSPKVDAPGHPYGLTKRWAEEIALSLRASFDALAIVRPGMTYGRDQSTSSGMGRVLTTIRFGRRYGLAMPDGDMYSPVYIDDVVDVLARLVERPANVAVNVGGIEAHSERVIVSDLASSLGTYIELEPDPGPPRSMAASPALADTLFPDRTRTRWRDGVRLAFGSQAVKFE